MIVLKVKHRNPKNKRQKKSQYQPQRHRPPIEESELESLTPRTQQVSHHPNLVAQNSLSNMDSFISHHPSQNKQHNTNYNHPQQHGLKLPDYQKYRGDYDNNEYGNIKTKILHLLKI